MEEYNTPNDGEDRSQRDLAAEDTGGGAPVWQPGDAELTDVGAAGNDPSMEDTTMASGRPDGGVAGPTTDRSGQPTPGTTE